jgi:hypothetical protein
MIKVSFDHNEFDHDEEDNLPLRPPSLHDDVSDEEQERRETVRARMYLIGRLSAQSYFASSHEYD